MVARKRFLVRLHFRVLPRSALSRFFVDCAPVTSADEHMRANSSACPVKYDKTSSRCTHPTSVLCVGWPLVNRCCCFTRYNVNRLCMNVSGFKIAQRTTSAWPEPGRQGGNTLTEDARLSRVKQLVFPPSPYWMGGKGRGLTSRVLQVLSVVRLNVVRFHTTFWHWLIIVVVGHETHVLLSLLRLSLRHTYIHTYVLHKPYTETVLCVSRTDEISIFIFICICVCVFINESVFGNRPYKQHYFYPKFDFFLPSSNFGCESKT